MMPSIKAVIFDMGGVLLRCERPEMRAKLGEPFGLTRVALENLVFGNPVSMLASVGKASEIDLWEHVRASLNLPPANLPAFREAFWSVDDVDQELVQIIVSLKRRYKVALLSNAWMGARQSLTQKSAKLMTAFDVSIFSAEVGLAKPDPAIYSLILDQLGVMAQEAVFVDDFVENIEAAQKLGIHAIRFVQAQQAIADLRKVVAW